MTCFKEFRPKEMNTFDFALFVESEAGPLAYATCIELNKESVYMQHGGAFPPAEKSIKAVKAYSAIMSVIRASYSQATTRIRNTNLPMIKMALKEGFIINGIDTFKDETYLHLNNTFKEI